MLKVAVSTVAVSSNGSGSISSVVASVPISVNMTAMIIINFQNNNGIPLLSECYDNNGYELTHLDTQIIETFDDIKTTISAIDKLWKIILKKPLINRGFFVSHFVLIPRGYSSSSNINTDLPDKKSLISSKGMSIFMAIRMSSTHSLSSFTTVSFV